LGTDRTNTIIRLYMAEFKPNYQIFSCFRVGNDKPVTQITSLSRKLDVKLKAEDTDQRNLHMPDVTEQQAQQLIAFAVQRLGQVEGNGECWTLVNNGFESVGFHKPSAIYAWGRVVDQLSGARPGDVFQFSQFQVTVREESSDGGWSERTDSRGAPRHTAILESIDANGNATFLESNVNNDRNVQRNSLRVRTATSTEGGTTTTVTVSGSFIIYRPQAASSD
jgi:hypothetical protein